MSSSDRLLTRLRDNTRGSSLGYAQIPLIGSLAIVAVIVGLSSTAAALREVLLLWAVLVVVSAIAVLVPWGVIDHRLLLVVAVADVVVVAFLRAGLLVALPSLSVLVLIPVLWLSYSFGLAGLLLAVAGDYLVALLPFLRNNGWPATPAEWGGATLFPALVGVVAIAVHVVAGRQRRQRADLVTADESLRVSVAETRDGTVALRASIAEGLDGASAALTVVDTVDAGITFYDSDGLILLTNDTAKRLAVIAGSRSPLRITPSPIVFEQDRITPVPLEGQIAALAARGELVTRRLYWVGRGEAQRAVMATSQYARRASGELIGTVVATHDVTPLAEAIQARDEFLTTITHELRTPLTSMMGYLELIEDSVDLRAAGIATEFAVVQRNGERLLALITDLIVTAEGRAPLERRPADIGELAEKSLDSVRADAEKAGIRVLAGRLDPVLAEVDADRIKDVLDKLLSNAMKFNRAGGEIGLVVERDGDEVVVLVSDTGLGIADADLPRIFERFFRSAATRDGAIAGAGLGLSTAKIIVDAHRGTISASSLLGSGTTIELRLPLLAAAAEL